MVKSTILQLWGMSMRRILVPVAIALPCLASIAVAGTDPVTPVDRSYLWESEEAFGHAMPKAFVQHWPLQDTYGYDVDDIDLTLDVDFDTESIQGHAILVITATEAGLTELSVDLTDALTVTAVTVDEVPRSYSHATEQILITLDSPTFVDQQLSIRVEYQGAPPGVGNKSMRFGNHDGAPLVFTLSTPYSNQSETVIPISHYWRPCKDVPDDKSTFSLTITVPDSMLACSNGIMTSDVVNGDGTRTFTWEHGYPVAPYLVTLGATNYRILEETYNGAGGSAAIQHFMYPERYSQAQTDLDIIVPAIEFFASIYGEYPFIGEKYGVYAVGPGPAVEEQTMTATPGDLFTGGHFYDWLHVHELAHMWWGDCVTCESWEHVWLNEGFASYSEALWMAHTQGNWMLRQYMLGMDSGPYGSAVYDPPYVWHSVVYDKGAWVLHMLRWIMEDEAFYQFLLDYRAAYEYANVATDDLVAVAEAVYGNDLGWFFDPWIYEIGRPDYEYSWFSYGSGPYTVQLRIDQVQSPDYPTYKMPVKVRVNTTAGSEGFVVWDSLRTQVFDLVVSDEPTGVILDPKDWILADFTEVPTGVAGRDIDRSGTFLAQNTPNPFNPSTTIRFGLSRTSTIALRVFDVRGRLVRTLESGRLLPGEHIAVWEGTDERGAPVASGMYFYQLVGPDGVFKKRMVLTR